ncbi:hypothetical protein BM221_006924 [Beauveria bassiana]|uniref:Uncharacterized protein n=1 Tax=Beauveria bassiana TaxID=176275 RepID=A0A2N6NJ19_BEABA|nr:hypothetical protein BM221_006924 [Beauveria bassiana]
MLRRVMLHALAVRRPPYQETLRLSDQLRAWHDAQPGCLRTRVHPQHRLHRRKLQPLCTASCSSSCIPQVPLRAAPPLPDRAQGRPGLTTAPGRRAAPPPSPCSRCTSSSTTRLAPPAACTRTASWVSNLTLQHFLLASTVVCVDLSESRDMLPAERRRRQALLTRSHDVWAARRAYSSDARHATKILRAVLKRVEGGAPVCDDTGTVTHVSSSSAGVYPATGLEPPLAAMKMDMYVPPPPPPPPPPCVCPAQTEGSMVLVNCCAIQPQPLSLQQQGRQPPMQPPTPCRLLYPHHQHHDVAAAPATSQDMYYDLGAGGYMAMAAPDAQCPAPDFGPVSDLDTHLYSTEDVNWNSIDQFLRVQNNNNEEGWFGILQGA